MEERYTTPEPPAPPATLAGPLEGLPLRPERTLPPATERAPLPPYTEEGAAGVDISGGCTEVDLRLAGADEGATLWRDPAAFPPVAVD